MFELLGFSFLLVIGADMAQERIKNAKLFEDDVEMYREECMQQYRQLGGGGIVAAGGILGGGGGGGDLTGIVEEAVNNHCRQYIAKCVYNATYARVRNKRDVYWMALEKLPLSFCWDLCAAVGNIFYAIYFWYSLCMYVYIL